MIAADASWSPVRGVRIGLVQADKDEIERSGGLNEATRRRDESGLKQGMDALGVLMQAYRRATFFIQMPDPTHSCSSKAASGSWFSPTAGGLLGWCRRHRRTACRGAENAGPRHLFRPVVRLASPRREARNGPYRSRLVQAIDLLESVLLPILGGGRRPVIGVGSAITAVAKLLATSVP